MGGEESAGAGDVLLAVVGLGVSLLIFGSIVWHIVMKIRRSREGIPGAMREYADARGLTYVGDASFPRVTPLLRSHNQTRGKVSGELAPGLQGELAHYRFDRGDYDGYLNESAVLLHPLPEAGTARIYLDQLNLSNRYEPLGEAVSPYRSVKLESAEFSKRYELMVKDEASMVAIRQLFPPSFVVFLTEHAPEGLSFELEDGNLCVARRGSYWRSPEELDELCSVAATIAARIRADIAERLELRGAFASPSAPAPPPPPGPPPPPPPTS